MNFNRVINGMIRAAKLDIAFFEEAEHDTTYGPDALAAVLVATLLAALGGLLKSLISGGLGIGIVTLIVTGIISVVVFYFWAFLVYWVGVNLFKGQGDFGEVQRCLGFAWAPRALGLFEFIPVLNVILGIVAWVWSVVAGFIAVRQALDMDNTNAALTVIVSGVVAGILWAILMAVLLGGLLALIVGGAAISGALN